MPRSDVSERIFALAERVKGSPRLNRSTLMDILRDCYAEGCRYKTDEDRAALIEAITTVRQREGANRVYIMKKDAAPHALVIRAVFSSIQERSNASRYANALCQLAKMGVDPCDFSRAIARAGGITSLYWEARERTTKKMIRSKLTLSTSVEFTSGTAVSLVLMPNANGVFDVLSAQQIKMAS
ncbi:hypothetical protein [Sphingomonas daechungensis]|uniref:hypothetical protein n=1 Tax=Sphingomonas daechungensis TaxID=1176646 RepID=UPI0037848F7A